MTTGGRGCAENDDRGEWWGRMATAGERLRRE
jgi:hypothetical protein